MIAITSAETYRALQTRTSDLQESLEYQTATSDVLKVISRSSLICKAVLQTLLDTAARLCAADFGALMIRDGDVFRTCGDHSNFAGTRGVRAPQGFRPESAWERRRKDRLRTADRAYPRISPRCLIM